MPSHAADSLHEAGLFPGVCIARWFEVRGVVHAIAFLWLMRPISEASSSMFGSCAPRAKREKLSHLSESERCEYRGRRLGGPKNRRATRLSISIESSIVSLLGGWGGRDRFAHYSFRCFRISFCQGCRVSCSGRQFLLKPCLCRAALACLWRAWNSVWNLVWHLVWNFAWNIAGNFAWNLGWKALWMFFKVSVWNFVRYDSLLFFKFFGAGASGFFVLFCIFHTMPVWNLGFLLCVLVTSFFHTFSMCFFCWLVAPSVALLVIHTARNFP